MSEALCAVRVGTAIRPFRFETDRFAFANESGWDGPGRNGNGGGKGGDVAPRARRRYAKRCFVMSRAAVQFWKFATFAPQAASIDGADLVQRILAVKSIPVSDKPRSNGTRVVFPGHDCLRHFSREHIADLRDHLGRGWTTFVRPGNLVLALPPTLTGQAWIATALARAVDTGEPVPLWLYRYPDWRMVHSVVAYARRVDDRGRTVFDVYDPNYRSSPKRLTFDPVARRFGYPRTFFFAGGPLWVRPAYRLGPVANGSTTV